jgi:hypothetical protein
MGTLIGHRIIPVLIGAAVVSCSGDLTLPSDGGSGPAVLEVVDGDGQEGFVRSTLDPLVVKVLDARSQPMAGVAVVFEFESAAPGAEVSPSQGVTTSEGLASAEVRLGNDAGTHIVEARVDASALRATFDLNALERGRGRGNGGGGDNDDDEEDDD